LSVADSTHFFAVAAKAMRQVLADHARRKISLKRGGDQLRVTLNGISADGEPIVYEADEHVVPGQPVRPA